MTLTEAIDRSKSHDERASVEFVGDESDLLVALDQLHDGEIDSVRENDGEIDVWGWTDETPENEMDWRLIVTLMS